MKNVKKKEKKRKKKFKGQRKQVKGRMTAQLIPHRHVEAMTENTLERHARSPLCEMWPLPLKVRTHDIQPSHQPIKSSHIKQKAYSLEGQGVEHSKFDLSKLIFSQNH